MTYTRDEVMANPLGFVHFLKRLPFVHTVFRCENKAPLFNEWTQKSEDDEVLEKHMRKGGQIGLSLKQGWVVVDIDDNPDIAKLKLNYRHIFKTVRGVHLLFRMPAWANLKCETKVETLSGMTVDYKVLRPNRKGVYIIAPCTEEGRDFANIPTSEDEVDFLPVEFYLRRYLPFPVGEGKRNDTLFRLLRHIRLFLEEHAKDAETELKKVGFRLNNLLDEPLDEAEVERLIENAFTLPNEDGFEETIRLVETAEEESVHTNPFLNIKSVGEIGGKPRPYYWDGVCRRGDVVLLSGAPKSGKSTFVRSLALSSVNHTGWFGEMAGGSVLWFALEEYAIDIRDIILLASERYGLNTDGIYIVEANPSDTKEPVADFLEALRVLSEQTNPALVIVDTVGRLMGGIDINDYLSVGRFIESIRFAVRDIPSQPVVLLVHHTNKALEKTPLGSQAFQGSCDVLITLERNQSEATFSVVGRGTHPRYMEKTPLYFDMGILRMGEAVPQGVAKLVRLIYHRKMNSAEAIMNYGRGAFRADIRRLFRIGLLYEDGDKIYVNERHRLLDRYLSDTITDAEEEAMLFSHEEEIAQIHHAMVEYLPEEPAKEPVVEPEPAEETEGEGEIEMLKERFAEKGWVFLSEVDPFINDQFVKQTDHQFLNVSTPEEALERIRSEPEEYSLVDVLNRVYSSFPFPIRGELLEEVTDTVWVTKIPVAFLPTTVYGKTRWVAFYAPPEADLSALVVQGRNAVRKGLPFFLAKPKEGELVDDG